MNWQEAAQQLAQNKIGILPTDTLYGIVGSALNPDAVEHIYKVKHRDTTKPCIVLISAIEDLNQFKIDLSKDLKAKLVEFWQKPTSVIISCAGPEFDYLHRGTHAIAFRIPNKPNLLELLKVSGPLIAPSCNPESQPPALTIEQAKNYFGNEVDFYLDEGELNNPPSKVIQINLDGTVTAFR